jgi:Tol biopolymer transport system component
MTSSHDPDRLVKAFLEEGPALLPDRVLDAVRDDIHQTHQRVVFGPWRTFTRSRPFAAAAVIAVVAFGGLAAYLATRPVAPNVGATPRPSPLSIPQVLPSFHNNGAIVVDDGGLHAINSKTGKPVGNLNLPEVSRFDDVTWSPDGMQLAYAAPGGLWVVDVTTGDSRKITYCGTNQFSCSLAWSPDGGLIAVTRGGTALELIDPETGEVTRFGTPAGTIQPTWSPDGKRIAFHAIEGIGTGDQYRRLYVVDRDGSGLELLLGPQQGNMGTFDPSWSPDGSTIAYLASTPSGDAFEDEMLHVMLLDLDGSEPRELLEVGKCGCIGWAPGLTWSPDGTRLAVNAPGHGEYGLYLVNADGTGFHRIAGGALSPAWRPVP